MLKNRDIVCISSADWDNPLWTNQQHIMSRLSRANHILYIESLGLRRPGFNKKDITRLFRRLKKWFLNPWKGGSNVFVYSPAIFPFHKLRLIREVNRYLLLSALKHLIRKLDFKKPILWAYVPNAIDFVGKLGEKLVIYHCVDELSANPRIPAKAILRMEEEYIKKADLIFAASKSLFKRKRKINPVNTYYLPNVADVEHFIKANDPTLQIPSDIVGFKHPIIGFIGAISSYKLDFELIVQLAVSHRDWFIVLIGPLGEGEPAADISALQREENIFLLGKRDYPALPGYLKAFAVCILPNRTNAYTANMFPMKFFEYLASGKPIVSTYLPALSEYQDYFKMARDKKEFVDFVEETLEFDPEDAKEKRINLAKKYSWTHRLEEISDLVNKKLEGV